MTRIARRDFLATSSAALGIATLDFQQDARVQHGPRDLFPRLRDEVFLNAAGGTPLGTMAERGLTQYMDFWRMGPDDGRATVMQTMLAEIRSAFGNLIGATEDEISLTHCTKAGEQIVLDRLVALGDGANIVTNDLHFSGSLHNLIGLRAAGRDVRIVRHEGWRVTAEAMIDAMDERTALVCLTSVSNVNGHVENVRAIADAVHARGGYLYADIIQAAGVMPLDMHALGVDFAACSGYKWLFGPHGTGFFFARAEHQGTALRDVLFPGHSNPQYAPWVDPADASTEPYSYEPPRDATRYQPGHISYLGYCALYEGIQFIRRTGLEQCFAHSNRLAQRVAEGLDPRRYRSISPDVGSSPIVAFEIADPESLLPRLRAAKIVVSLGRRHLRVSPAIYNTDEDVDTLIATLNRS